MAKSVVFLYLPGCEVLDFAGPLQAFHEANGAGARYTVEAVGLASSVTTGQGLVIGGLGPLPDVGPDTLVVVPGYSTTPFRAPAPAIEWLARVGSRGATVAGICTGAFALGAAGLLNGRNCTTHWKRTRELQLAFPRAKVMEGCLFAEDDGVFTSGGLSSGIDLTLFLIERDYGPALAARVARELVVYLRRDRAESQLSAFLDHRNHLHPGVHRVQDHIVAQPEAPWTLETLSQKAALSPRHLTRVFRQVTGVGVRDYVTAIRVEKARALLAAGEMTVEAVAAAVGFADDRQLRRLWHRRFGTSPRSLDPQFQNGENVT